MSSETKQVHQNRLKLLFETAISGDEASEEFENIDETKVMETEAGRPHRFGLGKPCRKGDAPTATVEKENIDLESLTNRQDPREETDLTEEEPPSINETTVPEMRSRLRNRNLFKPMRI